MKHHTIFEVWWDMTVSHPVTRITHINENINRRAQRNKNCIFPDEVVILFPSVLKTRKLTMEMNRVLHRMWRMRSLKIRILPCLFWKFQWIIIFSCLVELSMIFHDTFFISDIWFIICIIPSPVSHSIPSLTDTSSFIPPIFILPILFICSAIIPCMLIVRVMSCLSFIKIARKGFMLSVVEA